MSEFIVRANIAGTVREFTVPALSVIGACRTVCALADQVGAPCLILYAYEA